MTYKEMIDTFPMPVLNAIYWDELKTFHVLPHPGLYGMEQAVADRTKVSYFNSIEKYQNYLTATDRKDYRNRYGIMTRPGRFIRKFGITDAQRLAELTWIVCPPQLNINVVTGEEIRKWYHYSNYSNANTDTLGNSCMRHSCCQSYFDIYVDHLSMVIATDADNKLHGRAIIWKDLTIEGTTDTFTLVDRIYGTDSTVALIKAWAHEQGYCHKERQSYTDKTGIIYPDGTRKYYTFYKHIPGISDYDQLPYLDTMSCCHDDDTLGNDCLNGYAFIGEADHTDGETPYNTETCCECGDRISQLDATEIDGNYYCEGCVNQYFTWSDWHEEYVHDEDLVEVDNEYYSENYLPSFIVQCEECGGYFNNNDSIRSEICDDCYDEEEDE